VKRRKAEGVMKFFLVISTFFSIVLLTMHMTLLPVPDICPSGVSAEHEHLEPQKVVAAYFLSWHSKKRYTPKHFEDVASKVTHLLYAFAEPKKDGSVALLHPKFAFGVGPNYNVPMGHFEQLLDIKRRHPHLKILLSIGGGGCDKTFLELHKKKLLKKTAKAFVKMLDSYTYTYAPKKGADTKTRSFNYSDLFDGIDINWEFSARGVKDEHAQGYLSFVKEIRKLLDRRARKVKREMTLTATLQISPAVYRALPLSEVAKQIDWFHVMAYDVFGFYSKTVGHNSPLCGPHGIYTIDGALNRIIDQGVSPGKLVLGVSGYGYKYGESNGHGKPFNRKSKNTKALFYKDIHKYFLESDHYERKWSERGFVPSLYSKKDKSFISYDDPESLRIKTQLAAEKRLAGVMFWALSYDNEDHDLVHSLSDNVGKRMFE
jgi:chitinase